MNPPRAITPHWVYVGGWILVAKAVYIWIVLIGLKFWGHSQLLPIFETRWPIDGQPVFESHFVTWDAAHYLLLATRGYASGVHSCAFYPLWPLVWRTAIDFGAPPVWGGVVLSNLLSTLGLALVYRAAALRFDSSRAIWTVLMMAVYPGNLFLQFSYSESIFLVLLMCLWIGLEDRRWSLAAFGALLLPLSRAIGIFSVVPIAFWLLRHPRIAPRWNVWTSRIPYLDGDLLKVECDTARSGDRWLGLLVIPFIGWAIYFGLIDYWTGNPFEGFEAQKNWGRHSILNLVNLPKFLLEYFEVKHFHEFSGSILDRLCFVAVACTFSPIWRGHRDLIPWVCVLGFLPAMSGSFTSYIRFAGMAFPIFFAWSASPRTRTQRLLRWGGFATMAVLHVQLVQRFVLSRWAG